MACLQQLPLEAGLLPYPRNTLVGADVSGCLTTSLGIEFDSSHLCAAFLCSL
jgi:hypothetical protein